MNTGLLSLAVHLNFQEVSVTFVLSRWYTLGSLYRVFSVKR